MSIKTAGVGHFAIPTAPAVGTSCTSGAANVFTTTYVQLIASTAAALYITGIHIEAAAVSAAGYKMTQLAIGGAGSETIIGQYLVPLSTASTVALGYRQIWPPIPVPISTRIACKTADSVGSQATLITLECLAASNYVDDAVAVTTVTTVTNQLTAAAIATGVWTDTVSSDFTTALSVGKSVMNGVTLGTGLTINAYTGNTAQTGDSFAIVKSGGTGDNAAIKTTIGAAGAGLTAVGLAASQHVIVDSGTVTTVTNQLTAAAVAAGVWRDNVAGDFTVSASVGLSVMNGVALGTGLTVATVTNQLTAAAVAAGVWRDAVAGDFTVSSSIGKSLYAAADIVPGGVGGHFIAGTNAATAITTGLTAHIIGTVDTLTTYTGNTLQTGDSFARIGAAGAGLTGVTGVTLAASQHVIVDSGTVTTLTNLPAIPANWITAAGITALAFNGKGDWLLSSGYTAPPSAATIAGLTWDVVLSGHTTAGTTGAALNSAGGAADPWATALPGAYGAGTAGKIIGTNLDATISSRTKPADTQAAVTTVATVTGLTAANLDTTVSSRPSLGQIIGAIIGLK